MKANQRNKIKGIGDIAALLGPSSNQEEGDGAHEGKSVLPSKESDEAPKPDPVKVEEEDSWEDVEDDPGDDEESKQRGSARRSKGRCSKRSK